MKLPIPVRCSSAALLITLALATSTAFASENPGSENPGIEEQSCLYYMGEDAETLASHREASAAKRLGLKLGLSVRKRQAAQWLRGYQLGYAAAQGENVNQTSEETGAALDAFCANNRDSTLLDAAGELVAAVD